MAVLPRRTWANLRDELKLRVGRNLAAFDLRAQEYIAAAYFEIVTMYHHYELETADTTVVLGLGANFVTLPAPVNVVLAVRLRPPAPDTGLFIANLSADDFRSLAASFEAEVRMPKSYARSGDRIYFDSLPDQLYQTTIFYQQFPLAPDFAAVGQSAVIGRQWDEILLEWAVMLAWRALGRPELGMAAEQEIARRLAAMPHAILAQVPNYQRYQQDTQLPGSRAGGQG